MNASNTILVGDATTQLREYAAASIDTCVTSPPYFQLRNYGIEDQIGMEPHIDLWVGELRAVFHELARVLKPSGSVWLNVADSYSRSHTAGAPPKSLLLGPERLLLALLADGWVVRNKVVWQKPNPMPSSVDDRLSATWETIYLLVRSRRYFFDLDAIRVPHRSPVKVSAAAARRAAEPRRVPTWAGPLSGDQSGLDRMKAGGRQGHRLGKNPGDVIRTATSSYRGAHFATFPSKLIEPLVRATCPERVCGRCGRPWQRGTPRTLGHLAVVGDLAPACRCRARAAPGTVLDPFIGAGTVAIVAEQLQRRWFGIELNPAFAHLARERIDAARATRSAAEAA